MGASHRQGGSPPGLLIAARLSLAGRWTKKTTKDYEGSRETYEGYEKTTLDA